VFRKVAARTMVMLGLVSFSAPIFGDGGSYNLSMNGGSHLWLDGNSTLHKFESVTSTFVVKTSTPAVRSPTIPDIDTLITLMSGNFVLDIPVQSLKNPGEGSVFDSSLWADLRWKEDPDILFSLTGATATPDPSVAGRYDISAQGSVTVAGKKNPEVISAVLDMDDNTLRITGTKDLLMTDFGIQPPAIFFGLLAAEDTITVRWDLSLSFKPAD